MEEYKLFHVTRNLPKHAFELDDAIYGSPEQKEVTDWAVKEPELYVQRLKTELSRLEMVLSDLQFVMRCKYNMEFSDRSLDMTDDECDAYCYHKFHHRSFTYAEKISYLLQSKTPEEIDTNKPKAMRQLKVLEAAIQDVNVSIKRFTKFCK